MRNGNGRVFTDIDASANEKYVYAWAPKSFLNLDPLISYNYGAFTP